MNWVRTAIYRKKKSGQLKKDSRKSKSYVGMAATEQQTGESKEREKSRHCAEVKKAQSGGGKKQEWEEERKRERKQT